MFKDITSNKIKYLNDIADMLPGFTFEDIEKSSLPDFNKKFLKEESKNISDKKQLTSLLDKSVKLLINYTIRPKWTLINYLYGGFDSKSTDEILRKISIFQFYKYYKELISNYIKSNSLIFITSAKVTELIDETNTVLCEKLTTDISGIKIKNFFIQIFKLKYGEEKDINLEDSLPFVFIRLFLEDKNFYELLEKFKIIEGLKDNDNIELKSIIKVLMNKYVVNKETVLKENEEIAADKDKIVIEKEESALQVNKKQKKNFRKLKIDNKFESEAIQPVDVQKKIDEGEQKNKIKEKEIYDDLFEHHPPGPDSKKIRRIFKEGELNIIAKKVFKSSRMSMFSAFEELEKFKTWSEAVGYLKELFKKNNVDRYNKYVILFIDLLNDYYTNIEKGYI